MCVCVVRKRGWGSSRRQFGKGVETEEITGEWQPEKSCEGDKSRCEKKI